MGKQNLLEIPIRKLHKSLWVSSEKLGYIRSVAAAIASERYPEWIKHRMGCREEMVLR